MRVSCVCPGVTATPLWNAFDPAVRDRLPARRIADAADVAAPASPDAGLVILARCPTLDDVHLLAACLPSSKQRPDESIVFVKPSTAAIGPGGTIRIPPGTAHFAHEPELAAAVGGPCSRVAPADVDGYILGTTCLNDLSARDMHEREVRMTRANGFDTFAPFCPSVVTGVATARLGIRSYVNGEVVLETTAEELIFGVGRLANPVVGRGA